MDTLCQYFKILGVTNRHLHVLSSLPQVKGGSHSTLFLRLFHTHKPGRSFSIQICFQSSRTFGKSSCGQKAKFTAKALNTPAAALTDSTYTQLPTSNMRNKEPLSAFKLTLSAWMLMWLLKLPLCTLSLICLDGAWTETRPFIPVPSLRPPFCVPARSGLTFPRMCLLSRLGALTAAFSLPNPTPPPPINRGLTHRKPPP